MKTSQDPKESPYPDGTGLPEVNIELAVADGMTKTIRRVTHGGILVFANSSDELLTIDSKANPKPFIVPPSSTPVSTFTVDPHASKPVQINPAYAPGSFFTYTAQIGNAAPEDPIVIIERH